VIRKDSGVVVDAPRLELLGESSFSLASFQGIRDASDGAHGEVRGEPVLFAHGVVDDLVKFVLVEHSFSEGNSKNVVASASERSDGSGERRSDLRRGI